MGSGNTKQTKPHVIWNAQKEHCEMWRYNVDFPGLPLDFLLEK